MSRYSRFGGQYDVEAQCKPNPEPTDVQLALFRRHKAAGTSPGNPKWYEPLVVQPFVFKAGLPAKMPYIETGAQFNTRHNKNSATKWRPAVIQYVDGTTRQI